MWYVIQVRSRYETELAEQCRTRVLLPGEDVYVMYGERMFFRSESGWAKKKEVAFKGYLFVQTDDAEDLRKRLRKLHTMVKLLGVGDEPAPISPEEEALLFQLGGEEHVIACSTGYKIGDRLVVTKGPMYGMEGYVKWTDRHRRMAGIEVELLGHKMIVKLGCEILDHAR